MSSVTLHPRTIQGQQPLSSPLPQLLHTPSGLAILELQGTINLPSTSDGGDTLASAIPVGRLDFPEYNPDALDPSNTAWMKRVYLYIGQHQRLTGEAKKLPKPIAVIRRRGEAAEADESAEELEVVEIVKYKLVFSQRPEPVGSAA